MEEVSVDRDSIDRIRSATFPVGRRGYDKREVDRFLNRLADWLETGGADQTRAETVRRDLERVGEQTGKILTDAHDAGDRIRTEAERDAARLAEEARAAAEESRTAADQYAAKTRGEADDYADATRAAADEHAAQSRTEADAYSATSREGADAYAAKTREEIEATGAEIRHRADRDAEQTEKRANAEAKRILDEAARRRSDIETVIADLEARRDAVVADLQRLSSELAGAATEHGPNVPAKEDRGGSQTAASSKTA